MLLTGCDLLNESDPVPTKQEAVGSLFSKSNANVAEGPKLSITAKLPGSGCYDENYEERYNVEYEGDYEEGGNIIPIRHTLGVSSSSGEGKTGFVIDPKNIPDKNQRNGAKRDIPYKNPPEWVSRNLPLPDDLGREFENGDGGDVKSGDRMVKVEGKMNIGIESEEELSRKDKPREIEVSFNKTPPEGYECTRTEVLEVSIGENPNGGLLNEDEIELGTKDMNIVFFLDETGVSPFCQGSADQGLPNLGKMKVRVDFGSESKYAKSLKIGHEKLSSVDRVGDGEYVLESKRRFIFAKGVIEGFQEKLDYGAEVISNFSTVFTLVTFTGLTAVPIVQATTGAARAALLMLSSSIEVLPGVSSRITSFPGSGAGTLVSSVLKSGTTSFFRSNNSPPEDIDTGTLANCEYQGTNFRGEPRMRIRSLEEDGVESPLDNAVPLLIGPHLMVGLEEQTFKPRPAGRRVAHGEVRLSPGIPGSGNGAAHNAGRNGNMVAFTGNTAGEGGFDPVTEIRQLDGSEGLGTAGTDVVRSSMVDDGLTDVGYSSVAWGQIDGTSESPDLIVSGFKAGGFEPSTRLYENNGGNFEPAGAGLTDVGQGDVSWVDFDGDGRQDILVSGFQERESGATDPVTKLYRNTGNGFEPMGADLVGVGAGEAAWADYDGDGDLDLILTGRDDNREPVTQLYENTADGFTPRSSPLPDVDLSSVAWGDYNGDGSPDLVIAGRTADGPSLVELYRNDGGSLSLAFDSPIGVERGDLDWADYDSDGDLDLALSGLSVENNSPVTALVENTASSGSSIFGDVKFFGGASLSSVDWGDMGNDGNPDLIVSGLGSKDEDDSNYRSPKTVVLENEEE